MSRHQICNHSLLSHPHLLDYGATGEDLIGLCGKFYVLDRLLVKLVSSCHYVDV